MILLKTVIFTFVVPGTVTLVVPYWLLSTRPAPLPRQTEFFQYFGVPLILIGAIIYSWCAWDFTFAGKGTPAPIDPPKELVVRGLYRYVRNPMYVGVLSILIGEAMVFRSLALFEFAAIAFIFFHLFVVFYEERTLGRRFGESYLRYLQTVPRWLPWKIKA